MRYLLLLFITLSACAKVGQVPGDTGERSPKHIPVPVICSPSGCTPINQGE